MSKRVSGYTLAAGDVFTRPGCPGRVHVVAHTEPAPAGTCRVVTTDGARLVFTPEDMVAALEPAGTLGAVMDTVLSLRPGQAVTVWRGGPDGALYL